MNGSDGSTADARNAMQQAQRLDETVCTSTRWYARFLLTCGCFWFVWIAAMAIVAEAVAVLVIGGLLLVALPSLGVVYVNRQRVTPYSYTRFYHIALSATGPFMAITVGISYLPDGFLPPGFPFRWLMLLLGAITALPFFVGAYREFRR